MRTLIAAYGSAHVEIATYWALEMAASAVGDTQTAQLARDHRAEEEAFAREVHASLLARSAGAMDAGSG